MRLIRELSLLLNLVAGLIIVIWGIVKGISAVLPGLGTALDFLGRSFFANSAIPMPIRFAVPMLVVGIALFFASGGKGKQKVPSKDFE